MAAISPSSAVQLLSVPLNKNNKNQIHFTSAANQRAYFESKITHTYTNFTYQRQDSVIRIPAALDDILNCNYVSYQNSAYGSKWFYAYIISKEYVNDNMTALHIKTDVYQTWLFEAELKQSFVVREHVPVADDWIGHYLVDEGLNTGDYVNNDSYAVDSGSNLALIIASTHDGTTEYRGEKYSGVFSGYTFFAFNVDSTGITAAKNFISTLDTAGKGDAIGYIFICPKYSIPSFSNGDAIGSTDANHQQITVPVTFGDLDGYTPKNIKMYTYPYCFMYATTNNGAPVVWKYEYFFSRTNPNYSMSRNIYLDLVANLAPDAKVLFSPKGYRGTPVNYDESIILEGFPLCSWTNDYYKNWLAQNGVSAGLSVLGSVVSATAGIATLNPIAIAAGVVGTAQSIGQFYEASVKPNQSKGSNRGSINTAAQNQRLVIYQRSLSREFAEIIDNYFEMYGYKINEVKIPNVTSRPYWNYIQTIDVNITGNIPDEDMEELKSIYNSGVTLWHNPAYIYDYSLPNHPEVE